MTIWEKWGRSIAVRCGQDAEDVLERVKRGRCGLAAAEIPGRLRGSFFYIHRILRLDERPTRNL